MRAITKQGNGGFNLSNSHRNPPQTADQATSRWSSFAHKPALQQNLLSEQFHLCCYSELRADLFGVGYHIEHIENKSQNPQRTFDYSNLAASALSSPEGLPAFKAQNHEVFGGHASGKRQPYDINRFISCHQSDCQRYFSYLSDGRVVPTKSLNNHERDCAAYTIKLLNLNSPYLLTFRRKWWDELDDLFQEHQSRNWSLHHLAAIDLTPTNDKLSSFFSLTSQFFGSIAEQVLKP